MSITTALIGVLVFYGAINLWGDIASLVRRARGFDREIQSVLDRDQEHVDWFPRSLP